MLVIMQATTPAVLTPATCERLELTFQQLSQSHHAAVREDAVQEVAPDVKMENGHSSVGSDFQSDSSTSETWASANNSQVQQRIVEYVETPSGVAVANNVSAASPPRKPTNRPTGPRKSKSAVVVSTILSVCSAQDNRVL